MNIGKQITDAEWQVMKVLWENEMLSSGEIVKKLNTDFDWSTNTVKTFLSRLVNKAVLGVDTSKRFPRYYPLYTEMECVKQEMQNIIKRVYGGNQNHETVHFAFYGANDQTYIETLALSIEGDYARISKILNCNLQEKQSIYIYSTQKRLHSALGVHDGPKWLRAGWTWEILHIAPKETFSDIEPERVLAHVLSQLLIHRLNPNLPYFLQQGFSAYLSRWLKLDRIKESIMKNYEILSIEALKQINDSYDDFRYRGGYELGFALAEFIVDKYGNERLLSIIKNCQKIEEVITNDDSLVSDFKHYLLSKYIGVGVDHND